MSTPASRRVPADAAGVEGYRSALAPQGAVRPYQSQHGQGIPVGHWSGIEYVQEKRTCSGFRKADGEPCGAWAMPGESYCQGHLPKGS